MTASGPLLDPPRMPLLRTATWVVLVFLATAFFYSAVAQQWVGVPATAQRPSAAANSMFSKRNSADPNAQMLVQADQMQYDYANERVSAVGNVQINYLGGVLSADRVVYDQKTSRLRAEGNVRLTEPDGKILYAEALDLSSDYRDGFVDSLHIETADQTRFAAARADRSSGRMTVFQSGVYTACLPCKDNPEKPPKWQVKSARILHDSEEKIVYFEDARIEFLGIPIAYMPYFWTPDPSVKRKTGLLTPRVYNGTKYGVAVQAPFFWNLAPDYDVTFAPMLTSKQGLLVEAEWRQRLINGAYSIRAAGIVQQDKEWFLSNEGPLSPGYRDFRGAVETKGLFRLGEQWVWGWDGAVFTDRTFAPDYKIIKPNAVESVSQAFLTGRGERSFFDLRALHFYGFSTLDVQRQLPIVHPVLDYSNVLKQPVLGGEVSYNVNLTSLSRREADFDPINLAAQAAGICNTDNPAAKTRADCLMRGVPGHYSRLSADVHWRRQIIDPFGQVFTPFAFARADAAEASISPQPSVANFIPTGDDGLARGMVGVGLEYRYPLLSTHAWGTQTFEPVAQIIARPDEQSIGRFPNEDSQSLVFGDDNLFKISKFSGWDRVEGGTRANVGLQYGAYFNQAGYFNALFGQSYHLAGRNSYAVADMANTGLNSGLETSRSDYVARMTYQPNSIYTFNSRFRFDEDTFALRRMEIEGRATFDRWSVGMLYGDYDAQPAEGLLLPREGILGYGSLKITQNWNITGAALYNIESSRLNTASVGLGYIDECIAMTLYYISNYGFNGDIVPNRTVMLQISLRTLGGTSFTQSIAGLSGSSNSIGGINGLNTGVIR
jgi:LPS-assembly protein